MATPSPGEAEVSVPGESGSADGAAEGAAGGPVDRQADRLTADPPGRQAGGRRRIAVLVSVAVVVVALDVVSKILVVAKLTGRAPLTLVPHVLDLQLTRNAGAAFSIAAGATVIFTIVAVAVVVVIARTARRLRSTGWAVVLGLLLGGALGNLSDRLFRSPGPLRGQVVDWIHLHHWPVFNLADSSIVVGAVLAVLLSLRGVGLDGRRVDS